MALGESLKFLGKYIKNPRFTGAVWPSSRFLAGKMARFSLCPREAVVVELGPGTGPVTKALLDGGVAPENLYSIEFDPALASDLKARFPGVKVVNDSAENISTILGSDISRVKAIVSSLPLLSLPKTCVDEILRQVESVLPKGGRFVQFTYNIRKSPQAYGFKSLKHVEASIVLMNVPPARVDAFEKF